jgi:(1->4)-alpha-D-glucan 1-alpha-D-glucosylmutase
MKLPSRLPRATYRVQMHADFNFEQLAQIVPYLHELGISDLYLSPPFCAAPGSRHGYDVCDHNKINPKLGGREGLNKVSHLLQERGMGMIVDFVPNHMGIEGALNWRWLDVLEHGRFSRFASFFDIQWNPRQTALQDRILLPILHDFYGRVLESGEFHIKYEETAFWICYRSLRFPLCPESYALLLQKMAWIKNPGSSQSQKLESLAEQFRSLPKPIAPDHWEEITERNRQRSVLRQKLATLIEEYDLKSNLDLTIEAINGNSKNPDSFDTLHQILEEQNYRLAYWKTGTHEINYRRFFAIDTLIGLCMESREVFEETHGLLKELIEQGIVNGVRVDHIDGLWDPAQYLQWLCALKGPDGTPVYSLVEKILAEKEDLQSDWMTHGTTGYDFAACLGNLFIASRSEDEFTKIYREFAGMTVKPDEQAFRIKLYIMDDLFPNALDSFALDLETRVKTDRRWRDWTVSDLRPALSQVIACLSVYRTYRVPGKFPDKNDVCIVEKAVAEALRLNHSADAAAFRFIEDIWTGRYPDEKADKKLKTWADTWICRLQQYTGAIMAKSVEDTFFYRYVRLFAANEVGHHPAEFGRPLSDFHARNQRRLEEWPATMLATSTHDTKMSEDVRARLYALSEIPQRWDEAIHRWSKSNHSAKTLINNLLAPDANEEYLLYQILLGAWPLDDGEINDVFCDRIKQYMRKALSESKAHTNWNNPDESWLKASDAFIDTLLDRKTSAPFWEDFLPFARHIAFQGMKLALAQIVLKLTVPGVPDFYQGSELWNFSLVDPDNRRPVDYGRRQQLLQNIDRAPILELFKSWKDGRIKMHLIRSLLQYRKQHPSLFSQGDYIPLKITGPSAERFVAFLRRQGSKQLLVVALRRMDGQGVADLKKICEGTTLILSTSTTSWHNLFTDHEMTKCSTKIPLETIFDVLPVAVYYHHA